MATAARGLVLARRTLPTPPGGRRAPLGKQKHRARTSSTRRTRAERIQNVRCCADRGRTNVHVHGEASMARIAIITGAASGIGRALARALVLRGDPVVVAAIDGDGAERVAAGLARQGPGAAVSAALDVRDAAAVAALVRSTHDSHGRLDVMVNNAGIAIGGWGRRRPRAT